MRSTRPDANGKFSIQYLEPGMYTLVITSDGHATGVVTGVPVGTGMTAVSSSTSAIALPASASAMSEITGNVSLSMVSDATPAVTSAFTEALVRAGQQLASGESIEVHSRSVDGALGTYRLTVPKAPLVRAAYAASGTLSFGSDMTDAGHYSVEILVPDDALQRTECRLQRRRKVAVPL